MNAKEFLKEKIKEYKFGDPFGLNQLPGVLYNEVAKTMDAYHEMKSQSVSDELSQLKKLMSFSDRYQISVQFWPDQTAVYIRKDDVDLIDYGGDFNHAVGSAIEYLVRINNRSKLSNQ